MNTSFDETATHDNIAHSPRPWKLMLATVIIAALAPLIMLPGRLGDAPPEIFYRLFFFNDFTNSLAMLIVLVLALLLPPVRRVCERLAEWAGNHSVYACVIAFTVLTIGARFIYLAHPFSVDEYAPLMQSTAFAQGSLSAHYPPELLDFIVPTRFQAYLILVNPQSGQAMSSYWPGLALLMTPFTFLHVPWMFNPAISVLGLWLIGDLAVRSCGNERCRGWAMLAAFASPQFTVNAMSYYAMPGLLSLNLLFLWLLLQPGRRHAVCAGAVGSIALVMHNPVPHTLMAIPCVIWLLMNRQRLPRFAWLAVGYAPLTLLLALGWPILTSALGMARSGDEAAQAGFVAEWLNRLRGIFVLPSSEILTARWYATWKTWLWACPGLLLVPFLPRKRDVILKLLLSAFVLTFAFYYFLVPFDQGHGWGYRYIHSAWGLLPVAMGVWMGTGNLKLKNWGAVIIAAGFLATPVFLYQTRSTIDTFLSQRFNPPKEGNWIVFVTYRPEMYTADLVQNLPGKGRVVYMLSQGEEQDRKLMRARTPHAVEIAHDQRGSMWLTLDDILKNANE